MSSMLHLTAAFRPCPPHEHFTTGTIEGAWSNLNKNNTGNQNDDWGKLVPSSQKRRKFRHTIIRQFRKGNQSILEGIPIPDLLIVSYFYRCLYQVGNTCY